MLHNFHTYTFDQYQSSNLSIPEIVIPSNASASDTLISDTSVVSSPILQWRPTTRLRKLYTRFTNSILYQHSCIPCAYCGKLMYPAKTQWKPYDSNTNYPIEEYCSNAQFILKKTKNCVQIPVCSKCKSNKRTIYCPILHPIPQQILSIPLMQRRFLSPVFLHCSLGRNSGDNPFSEYRILTGDMKFSKNMRALQLYSGSMGAFMTVNNPQCSENTWCTRELQLAAEWLKLHNCYIRPYAKLLVTSNNILTYPSRPFPFAEHSNISSDIPPVYENSVVLPNLDFSIEIHNEDFHYTRLIAGFVQTSNSTKLPLSFSNPELEPLLFPDIFPDGHGHYNEIKIHNKNSITYGKYIKHRLLYVDSRFRLHPYWPLWSYLQLEKLRNHQNMQRIWCKKQTDTIYKPLNTAELITRSIYTGNRIIDESKTVTLPTFIRTGDSYFHEKLLHINAMIEHYSLPSLFLTLSMAEGKWTHLKEILKSTDNRDTLPTNRPLHTTLYFVNLKQNLKKYVWKQPEISKWGELLHFFERIEFQNRGAAHIHTCLWVSKSIDNMIDEHIIRSDLPDKQNEPELCEKVIKHQIHTCSPQRCGGPAPPGQQCKRGFPRPYSPVTYYKSEQLRYIYHCITPEDQWVVPYHPETLLIWNAHMNAQYVTSRGLEKYLTKYVVKPEPTHIFNVTDNDKYQKHVIARRLGSMECMFLLLGERICDSSIAVKYLTTEMPDMRSRAIRPIFLIDDNENNPYWNDNIDKYFARPLDLCFQQITYLNYFRNYSISTKSNNSANSEIYKDQLNNFVIRRSSPIVVRFRYLKIDDREAYFYQQLLCTLPCQSEKELLGKFQSYRTHYLHLNPDIELAIEASSSNLKAQTQLQFHSFIAHLLNEFKITISPNITKILNAQIESLIHLPPMLPKTVMLDLPEDQYQTEAGYQTLAFYDKDFNNQLAEIETLIIDEVSMVSASLFTFISNLFASIHNSTQAFEGINVIVVGDLAQLPPVRGEYVFHSSIWHLFYPFFLNQPHRHQANTHFYQMLEEIRFGNISEKTWNSLLQKANSYKPQHSLSSLITTTHIISYKQTADQLNRTINNVLPVENDKFMICEALDYINSVQQPTEITQSDFKLKTNLPPLLHIQQGARVMFLNNSLIEKGICNGTIGIITDFDKETLTVQVAFCIKIGIIHCWISRYTSYFYAAGQPASRTQFPLQNAFALTVHKTQGLTLPNVTLILDSHMFSAGQAYVSISRCPTWDNLNIASLYKDAFITDPSVIEEYSRLHMLANQCLPHTTDIYANTIIILVILHPVDIVGRVQHDCSS
ncbi:16859_t:CDS:2 [Acaulospora morrowiae]|uniref:ATP-dependent DNA helicase n=1 Tax=Acaulospora morrowiae TaxID=94023 RepID=A0A9N8WN15_9GLOM|nr:16859_t:CDS:2 [Acaulospora morrowiae]